ncbi:hypothetical protein FH972_025794 [Carpinus fangiana]|uniref:Uncharacterized protein n=1 Tax=Carpinus fangiana TaxID=176857 RepID=A0A5N6L2B4_9ROSI|nr:hypothetical protein FH972_025794 [Carpinus fangiana]
MDLRNAVDVDGHSVRDDKALQTGTGKPESPVRSSPQSSRLARYQMASALARLWKFELAAATFSLVAIAGIIITLAASDGKPLDDWHSVPPNIIVAFLAALVQLSFGAVLAESISQLKWIHFQEPHKLTDLQLFDEASRSRFGAVKLLLYTLWNSTTAAGSANESSDLLQDSTKMIDVNFIKFPPLSGSQSSETFVIPPLQQASHCSINLCARTYQNLSSVNGNFTFAWGPPARLKVRNVDQNTAPAGSDWLVFDPEVDAKIPPGFNNTFGISGLTAGEISGYLIELFNVAYTSSGTSLSNDPESSSYGDIFQTDRVAPIVTKVFNNTNDITRLMEQISQGITEAMRGGSNDEGESHAIVGTATHMVTVIKVRWAYLALPVVLTVVALVLLIIVILQTKSSGTMPWKSSCLGLLFHELSGWDDIKHNVNGQDDARRYADGMTAQIDATVGRPAFVNANALYNS